MGCSVKLVRESFERGLTCWPIDDGHPLRGWRRGGNTPRRFSRHEVIMDDNDREHLHSLQIPVDAKTWNGRAAASIGRLYAIASGNAARVTSSLEREYWRGAAGVYDAIVTRYRAWEYLLHLRETRAYVMEHAKAERRKATACRDRSPNVEAECHHDGRRDAWWRVYEIAYRQAWRAKRKRKAGAK